MALDIGVYRPNEILVEAVQVSKVNTGKVADWCGGYALRTNGGTGDAYVMVPLPTHEHVEAFPEMMIVRDREKETYTVYPLEEFERLYWRINEEQ